MHSSAQRAPPDTSSLPGEVSGDFGVRKYHPLQGISLCTLPASNPRPHPRSQVRSGIKFAGGVGGWRQVMTGVCVSWFFIVFWWWGFLLLAHLENRVLMVAFLVLGLSDVSFLASPRCR